jgi:hypothetical protein
VRDVGKHIASPFDGFHDRADNYNNGYEQSGLDNHLCLLQWEGGYRFGTKRGRRISLINSRGWKNDELRHFRRSA